MPETTDPDHALAEPAGAVVAAWRKHWRETDGSYTWDQLAEIAVRVTNRNRIGVPPPDLSEPPSPTVLLGQVRVAQVERDHLAELGRQVLLDHGNLCDHPDDCTCSAARLARVLAGQPEWPGRDKSAGQPSTMSTGTDQ